MTPLLRAAYFLRYFQPNCLNFYYPISLGASATEVLGPCGCNNYLCLNFMATTVPVPTSLGCLLPSYPIPACVSRRIDSHVLVHIQMWEAPNI